MSVVTRQPTSNASPSLGGTSEFNDHGNTGGSTLLGASDSPGGGSDAATHTCLWDGFADVPGQIVEKRVKFDYEASWDLQASVSENGAASAQFSYSVTVTGAEGISGGDFIQVSGPGPVSDGSVSGASGSVDQAVSAATSISSIQVEAFTSVEADAGLAGGSGLASAALSFSISNLRLEVTLVDGGVIVLM